MPKPYDSIALGKTLTALITVWREEDHPGGPGDPLNAGPFSVTKVEEDRFEVADASTLVGWFQDQCLALCAASALPIMARPQAYTIGQVVDADGLFPVLSASGEIGRARFVDDDIELVLGLLAQLSADPTSLAYMLEAAGPESLECAVDVLAARRGIAA